MNFFENMFINTVFILFSLFSYFLFLNYQKSCGKKINAILFDLTLYTSLYLIIRYNDIEIMLIIIPLLIAYINNKLLTALSMSLVIGLYYYFMLSLNPLVIILEFILYLTVYILFSKIKKKFSNMFDIFLIVKIIFLLIIYYQYEINYITFIFIILFCLISKFIYFILKECQKSSNLYITIKELEKEKQLRNSLFKITHEIKNPLAVCKGYLDMFDSNNKNHVEKYIPIIKQEIETALVLMNDFLSLTKLKVNLIKMDFSVVLNDIYESLQMLIHSNNINFQADIIDDEVYILGDYDRLKQVFINLIKNSIEAIPKDRKGEVIIKIKIEKEKIIIIINDNGIGIDSKLLKKIGEPFITTKRFGTGLGVRFSKEIIEAHKGEIYYNSKKGEGTRVTIIIPIIKNP